MTLGRADSPEYTPITPYKSRQVSYIVLVEKAFIILFIFIVIVFILLLSMFI